MSRLKINNHIYFLKILIALTVVVATWAIRPFGFISVHSHARVSSGYVIFMGSLSNVYLLWCN